MKNDLTRNDRLKAALRDNLRRRKAQSRVREQPAPEPAEPCAGGTGATAEAGGKRDDDA